MQRRSCKRPIPACAGETRTVSQSQPPEGAYPRVRGGNHLTPEEMEAVRGLSPRARGKRMRAGYYAGQLRPIPACAGET